MTNSTKRRVLSFFLLMVLITILLAATLPQLQLQKGIPLPLGPDSSGEMADTQNFGLTITISTFLKVVLSVLIIVMLIYYAFKIRQKPDWKEIVKSFLSVLFLVLLLTLILFIFSNVKISLSPVEPEILPPEVRTYGPDLGPVPGFLLWLVWIGLIVLVILFGVAWIRYRNQPWRKTDPLALEASQAIQALKSGQNFRSVILRCYEQMSLILQKEQEIVLADTMTTREFETLLHIRGIPDAPVQQLTRLFEIARYSDQPPGPGDEQNAIDCLSAIIEFCKKRGVEQK